MELKRDQHLRLQDEDKLTKLAASDPQAVLSERKPQFTPEYFNLIGIDYPFQVLGKGYIRLLWSDFIVEEINKEGKIISISPQEESHSQEFNEEKPKTEADLVKQGMPTFEAVERLAKNLEIPTNNINYAGLKDSGAVTSQEVSFNGIRPEKLANLNIPNLFLKNIHERKGVVEVGSLLGNRFTILVRTAPVEENQVEEKVTHFNQEGFLNFYSLQRFGPRLLSHKIGQLILQGKYQEAVKMHLIGESPHEMTAFRRLRQEAVQYWGNWAKMKEIFGRFPYFLYYELQVLESLKETSIGFVRALGAVQEQTKLFVYAYFSYLFNQILSLLAKEGSIPEELPLLRDYPEIKQLYQKILSVDEMNKLLFNHRGLEWLNLSKKQFVKTKIIPKIWHVTEVPVGYIFHFDLEKGAYATTLLSDFFNLYQGKPVPDWVNQADYDSRTPLGYSPVHETMNHFPKAEEQEKLDLLD